MKHIIVLNLTVCLLPYIRKYTYETQNRTGHPGYQANSASQVISEDLDSY